MAMLYELARTRLGLYVVGRKSCLSTVMYTVMMLITREGDEGRRLVMEVSPKIDSCDFFFPFVEHMNQNDSLD